MQTADLPDSQTKIERFLCRPPLFLHAGDQAQRVRRGICRHNDILPFKSRNLGEKYHACSRKAKVKSKKAKRRTKRDEDKQ